MTCRELADFLLDYLSGELAPAERARFDEHLAECPDCVHYLATYQETIRLGKLARGEPSARAQGPREARSSKEDSESRSESARGWGPSDTNDPIPDEVPEELVQAVLEARKRSS